jgi:hypothetical protein
LEFISISLALSEGIPISSFEIDLLLITFWKAMDRIFNPAYTVTTNLTTWEVVVTPVEATWCKVTRDGGDSRFTIAVDANPTTSPRGPATVTVTAGTALPLQIIVNQRANTSQETEDFGYGDEQKWDWNVDKWGNYR